MHLQVGGRSLAKAGESIGVLVLTRKLKQSIMIGDDVELTVLAVHGEKVRLGIQAPAEVAVFRSEIYREIARERATRRGRDHADSSEEGLRPGRTGSREQR
jgi:carbon storage regulator